MTTKGRTGNKSPQSPPKKPRKRPTVVTAADKRRYCEALAVGLSHKAAAEAAGHPREVFARHRQADEDFAIACLNAYEAGTDTIEDLLRKSCLDGNVTAQIFALKNRRPDRWRDRHEVKHEGIPAPDVQRLVLQVAEASLLEDPEARSERVSAVLAELAATGEATA